MGGSTTSMCTLQSARTAPSQALFFPQLESIPGRLEAVSVERVLHLNKLARPTAAGVAGGGTVCSRLTGGQALIPISLFSIFVECSESENVAPAEKFAFHFLIFKLVARPPASA